VLHEPGPIHMSLLQSSKGIPVAAGQPLTLTSRYDNQFPHVRAMGLMLAYIAPDPRVTAPCGPIPSDVKAIGSATPGRSHAAARTHPDLPLQRRRAGGAGDGAKRRLTDDRRRRRERRRHRRRLLRRQPLDPPRRHRDMAVPRPPTAQPDAGQRPGGLLVDRLVGGKTFSKQFTKPGTYQFFCELHPVGMIERVVVRPS